MQFQFRQSRDRLRLSEISAAVDVEQARRNAGVLQGVLKSLTYGAVDDADIAGCTVGEVAHGLRLSQVALQYQQHTQRQLADCVKALNEKNARLEDACGTLKAELDHHTKTASTLMHSTHEATAVEISRVRGELAHTQKDLDDERLANRRLTEDLMEARESIALLKERLRESRQVVTSPNASPAQNLSFNSVESTGAATGTVPAPNASTLQASIDHLARQLAMHAPPPPPSYPPAYPPPAYAHAQPPPATYYPPSHPPPFPANAAPLHMDPYVQSMLAAHLNQQLPQQQQQQQPPLPPREPSTGSRDSAVAPFPLAASHSSTAVARSSAASAASADNAACESVASNRKQKKEKKAKAEKKGKKEKKEKKAKRAEADAEADAASCEAPSSATHTAAAPSPVLQKAAPPAAASAPAPATAPGAATTTAAAASPASGTALAISPASAAPAVFSPASGIAAPSLDDIQEVLRRRDEAKRRFAEECREANAALLQAETQGRGEASDEELLARRGLLSAHFEEEADARAATARRVEAAEAAARAERARQQEEEWEQELERRRVQEQVSRSEEERERQMRRASASVIDPYTPTLLKPLASAAAPSFDAHNESEGDNASSSEEAVRMPPAAQPAATSSVPQRAPLGLPPPAKQSAGSFGIPPVPAPLATGAGAGAAAAATEHDVSHERMGCEVMSAQGTVGSCPSLPNDSFSNNDMKLVMCDKCGDEVLEAAVAAHKQVCLHRDDDTGTSTSEDNGDTDEEDEPLPIHLSQRTPSVSWKLDNAPSVPEPTLQRASSSLILQETRSQLEALEREQAAADRARNASSSSSSMMLDNPS